MASVKNIFFSIRRRAPRVQILGIAVAAIAGALAGPLRAEQCIVLEDFSSSTLNSFPPGWKPREEPGRNVYVVVKEGDMLFVRARATGTRAAGNGIEADRPVKWNIEEYPILRWQWRPRVFPRGADEYSGKDDSALGLYIGFCPPEDLALCERSLKGQLGLGDRIALPKLLLTKGVGSLKYIWSERLAKGFEFDKGRKAVKVLESGVPTNRDQWVEERVDIAADYRRRFGVQKLLNPIGLSILTDSDDTQSLAEGDYADFKLCRD
ncbi:MAG TPA: DUF3047 domain-containing protein [Candidatus Binatia bacterium]